MSFNFEYLQRSLERRIQSAAVNIEKAIERMMSEHAAKGLLQRGATVRQFDRIAIDGFANWFSDAAVFVYSLTDRHDTEVGAHLNFSADQLSAAIGELAAKRARNAGSVAKMIQDRVADLTGQIQSKKNDLLDDFIHGMLGSERMKKDPLVSVTATQQNSPGAVQQLGIGSNKQTATVENYRSIIDAVDSIINSGEYRALPEDKKVEFKDIADVLKEEAAKQSPDAGKLRRWAEKLKGTAQDLGMKVAMSALATLIASMFG
jgi:hypothetical protein